MRYLGAVRYLFFKNYPAQVIFFITDRCNMKCRMCFYWRNIESGEPIRELSFDEISCISRNMKPFLWLMIGGGEPFLRKDIADICELFYRNNRVDNITIPTNGADTGNIEKGVRNILDKIGNTYLNINFSLDGIGEMHDEIRGVSGAFNNVIRSYNVVKGLKDYYHNLGVAINIVYSPLNSEKILEISDYIIKVLRPDNLALIFVRGDTREYMEMCSPERYLELAEKITQAVVEGRLSYYNIPFKNIIYAKDILMRRIIYRTRKTNTYQIPCFAGRLSIVISEDGKVFPCELKGQAIGDLRKCGYNLGHILTKDNIKRLKEEIQKGRCFCTHECFYTMNILFNLQRYPALFREWVRLNVMKIYACLK